MTNTIQNFFESVASFLEHIVFFNILSFTGYNLPLAIFFVLIGAIYFTITLKFINFRKLGTSVKIFFEKEKEEDGSKAVTSKAAFLSAISGCVGVGSISGVAAALYSGGPGAVFWMLVIGFLIMPLRYAEVFLGHFFRTKEKDGTISRYGPYAYIENGLTKEGYSPKLAKFLFVFYVISILLGAVGAFIMQANPLAEIAGHLFFKGNQIAVFGFSVALAGVSLFVILGGLKRIVHTMESAVSVMSLVYIIAILLILMLNIKAIPSVISLIFTEAFNPQSIIGGVIGVLIVSLTRVVVSTEVGLGTVSFLHGKSQNDNSIREGLLAMAGPFVVNFVFITLNSIAVLATASHLKRENGILMISRMFESVHHFFPIVLFVITFLFAFTTIIAWYFYAESSLMQISKSKIVMIGYQIFFFVLIAVSGLVSFGVMIRIIDAMVFAIVFPNILALLMLGKVVKRELFNK
jgi:AGCS family alanine or glycine:cation symporter